MTKSTHIDTSSNVLYLESEKPKKTHLSREAENSVETQFCDLRVILALRSIARAVLRGVEVEVLRMRAQNKYRAARAGRSTATAHGGV